MKKFISSLVLATILIVGTYAESETNRNETSTSEIIELITKAKNGDDKAKEDIDVLLNKEALNIIKQKEEMDKFQKRMEEETEKTIRDFESREKQLIKFKKHI